MVIAGPNLTIDRTLAIDALRPGEVLRFQRRGRDAGRQGRQRRARGARPRRGRRARRLRAGADRRRRGGAAGRRGIVVRGVEVGGELRSTAVVLERSGRVTVFNEPGPSLAPGDWERYEARGGRRAAGERVLACSGSLPPGAPDDAYARLVALARAAGAVAIVDVGGRSWRRRWRRAPTSVTPNLAEAEGLLHGRADETVETRRRRGRARRAGSGAALVERGPGGGGDGGGCRGGGREGCVGAWLAAPRVAAVRNPIGRGRCAGRWARAGARARRGVRGGGGARDGVRGGERGDRRGGRGGARAGGGAAAWSDARRRHAWRSSSAGGRPRTADFRRLGRESRADGRLGAWPPIERAYRRAARPGAPLPR